MNATTTAAHAAEYAAIHAAACRCRRQGLVCSTCSELTERAERAIRAGATVQIAEAA